MESKTRYRKVKLAKICSMKYGKMPKKSDIVEKGYPIFSGYRITGFHKEYLYKNPEVVLVARGVGGTGDVKLSPPKSYITNLSIVLPIIDTSIDKTFLYLKLSTENLRKLDSGSAQSQITIADLQNYEINVPSLPVQENIVKIICAYDNLIENNTRRIKILEEMAQNIYKEWFVNFRFPHHKNMKYIDSELGTIPENWTILNLFDFADLTYGFPFKSKLFSDTEDVTPVVRIRDIKSHKTKTYTPEIPDKKYLIRHKDILIGMDGDFHMVNWQGGRAYLNQRIVRIRPKNGISFSFLFLALQKPIKYFDSTITGTTVAHLGDTHLKTINLLIPDKDILNKVDAILDPILEEQIKLNTKNENLRKTRDLLLPRLISGEIDVENLEII